MYQSNTDKKKINPDVIDHSVFSENDEVEKRNTKILRNREALAKDLANRRQNNPKNIHVTRENKTPMILIDSPSRDHFGTLREQEGEGAGPWDGADGSGVEGDDEHPNDTGRYNKGFLAPNRFIEDVDSEDEAYDEPTTSKDRRQASGYNGKQVNTVTRKGSSANDNNSTSNNYIDNTRNFGNKLTLKQTANLIQGHNQVKQVLTHWINREDNPESMFNEAQRTALKIGIPPGIDQVLNEELIEILDRTHKAYSRHYPKRHFLVKKAKKRLTNIKERAAAMTIPTQKFDVERLFGLFTKGKKSTIRPSMMSFKSGSMPNFHKIDDDSYSVSNGRNQSMFGADTVYKMSMLYK